MLVCIQMSLTYSALHLLNPSLAGGQKHEIFHTNSTSLPIDPLVARNEVDTPRLAKLSPSRWASSAEDD